MVVVLGEYLLPHYPTGMRSRGNVIMLGTGQRRLDTRHIASSLPAIIHCFVNLLQPRLFLAAIAPIVS